MLRHALGDRARRPRRSGPSSRDTQAYVADAEYDELRTGVHWLRSRTSCARRSRDCCALLESAELPGPTCEALLRAGSRGSRGDDRARRRHPLPQRARAGREVVALGETEAAPVLRERWWPSSRSGRSSPASHSTCASRTRRASPPLRRRMLQIVAENLLVNVDPLRRRGRDLHDHAAPRGRRRRARGRRRRDRRSRRGRRRGCSSASSAPTARARRAAAAWASRSSST